VGEEQNKQSEARDAFYVGYLPMNPSLRRWVGRLVVGLVVVTAGVAVAMSALRNDPGPAVWDIDEVRTWEGVIRSEPHPMLVTEKGPEGTPAVMLLVSEGKVGADDRVADMDGKRAVVRGTLLRRHQWYLVELVSDDGSVEAAGAVAKTTEPMAWQDVTLEGEIMDPKCYLGAMKPGEGKAHKACAALCIRGGIPPMYRVFDAEGRPHLMLLVGSDGRALRGKDLETVIDYVGDAVVVNGQLARRGGYDYLMIGVDDVRRR
jgi:hypothetical protein